MRPPGPTIPASPRRSPVLAKIAETPPCGILLLDKPQGLTSNAALQRVRWLFGKPKAGHTGSLDPMATGMLPICLGEATKLAGALLSEHKAYEFTLRLGVATDTGDADGEAVATAPVPSLDEAGVQAVLRAHEGPQRQVPPMHSALKRDGRPLYELARQGIEVERAPRDIVVRSLELLGLAPGELRLRVACSKGTYVRVLGEDLARALGSIGHLVALRRLHVEPFGQEALHTLEEVESSTDRRSLLLTADRAVPQLPAAHFAPGATAALAHGQAAQPERLEGQGMAPIGAGVRLYGPGGAFLGLGEAAPGGLVQPRRLLLPLPVDPTAGATPC